jgi:hypothetical protein
MDYQRPSIPAAAASALATASSGCKNNHEESLSVDFEVRPAGSVTIPVLLIASEPLDSRILEGI